jgi:hypothetical protein
MKKIAVAVIILAFALVASASAQDKSKEIAIFVVPGYADDAPVTRLMVNKLKNSKPFKIVATADDSQVVVSLICMSRKENEPYACMYISTFESQKILIGGGLWVSTNADDLTDHLIAFLAQDVVEEWNKTYKDNQSTMLEDCLALTDSTCSVPELLQAELGEKQVSLGQYVMIMKTKKNP